MFRKFVNFWRILFNSIKTAYNTAFKEPVETAVQDWRDIKIINFLAIFVDKLSNLSLTEATFDVESDSTIAEPMSKLAKDLEDKRYQIASEMLAKGDYYIFPATNGKDDIYHTYLTQQQVRILNMDGEEITEAYGIIDWFVDSTNNKTYFLLRHHVLSETGTLDIYYDVVDQNNKPANVEKWNHLKDEAVRYENANHIGFGRFKSPASSRGLSPVYGVPLNFACEDIEAKISTDMEQVAKEFKYAESRIFADPRNLKVNPQTGKYELHDNIFAVNTRAGQTGPNIDVYSPAIRYNEYRAKYVDDLMQYEQQIGVDRGFLTPFESGTAVTATEIRRANASTISMIDKIHNAMAKGVEDTIKADGVFLNISPDLYTVKIDWYDVFENSDTQWQRLLEAYQNETAESSDLVRFNFPNLTPDEIDEKLQRIGEKAQNNTDEAINRILQG